MKKFVVITAAVFIYVFSSCNQRSKPNDLSETAINTVESYLNKNLSDPRNYQPISFGQLKPFYNDTPFHGVDTTQFRIKGYSIMHSYKALNRFGKLALYNQKFILTPTLKSVEKVEESSQ